jgi:hypothetical protein
MKVADYLRTTSRRDDWGARCLPAGVRAPRVLLKPALSGAEGAPSPQTTSSDDSLLVANQSSKPFGGVPNGEREPALPNLEKVRARHKSGRRQTRLI